MEVTNLIKSIIDDFFLQEKNNVLYLTLSQDILQTFDSQINNDAYIIDLNNYEISDSPIAPFLYIIKKAKPSEQLVKDNCYLLQQDSFLSYFNNGICNFRTDMMITEELYYEKMRIISSIINMLKNIKTKTIVIKNAQLLQQTALQVINQIEENDEDIKIILCFDVSLLDNETTSSISYAKIAQSKNYFEIINSTENTEKTIISRPINYEYLFKTLRNARTFLSIGIGLQISSYICNNTDIIGLTLNQSRNIYYEIGLIYFYAEQPDEAALILNTLLEQHISDEIEIKAMLALAQILYKKSAFSSVKKNIASILQKASKDSNEYALANMFDYIIADRDKDKGNKYNEMLKLLQNQGLTNNRLYASLFFPYYYTKNEVDDINQTLLIIENDIKDAIEINNEFLLSICYHWKGIILTAVGKKEASMLWYKKSDEIRTKIHDITGIIKIRNGISYECFIQAEYLDAYKLINSFLCYLPNIKDYTEIIVTFFNLSQILFFSRNFEQAYSVLKKVINLMNLFDISQFVFSTKNEVIIIKAIIDFYFGNYTQAKIHLFKVLSNEKEEKLNVLPWAYFLHSLIELKDNNIDKSVNFFEKSVNYFITISNSLEHQLAFMYFEYASILDKYKQYELSNKYYEQGCKIANDNNITYYKNIVAKMTPNEYNNSKIEMPPLDMHLEYIEDIAKKEQLLNKVQKKIRDSQFLNKVMNMGARFVDKPDYIYSVSKVIYDFTLSKGIFIAECIDNHWNMLSALCRSEISIPSENEWAEYYDKYGCSIAQHVIEVKPGYFYCNISKFDFIGAVIIVPSEQTSQTQEDKNIVNTAITNLQSQLTMMNQNEYLLKISSTDQLSKLKNRRALQERLAIDNETIRRTIEKKYGYTKTSITFIDLDNFKHYNDTFGHDIGDLLIVEFSALLKKIYRCVDFISRFGGDEFVIILPNTTGKEAMRAAERLYEALEKAQHFVPLLQEKLGSNVVIEPELYLNFSAGTCCNTDVENHANMTLVMQNADKALYYAKDTGKSCSILWEDIKDKIE